MANLKRQFPAALKHTLRSVELRESALAGLTDRPDEQWRVARERLNLSQAYLGTGKAADARKSAEAALSAMDEGLRRHPEGLGALVAAADLAPARLRTDAARAGYTLSRLQLADKDPSGARRSLERAAEHQQAAVDLQPGQPVPVVMLRSLLMNLAEVQAALAAGGAVAKTAARVGRLSDSTWRNDYHTARAYALACRLLGEGPEREAAAHGLEAHLRAAGEKGRDSVEALANLAMFLAAEAAPPVRDAPRALRLAEQAVRQGPAVSVAWMSLGIARHRAGHFDRAKEAIDRSRRLSVGTHPLREHAAALILLALNDEAGARRAFERGESALRQVPTLSTPVGEALRAEARAALARKKRS